MTQKFLSSISLTAFSALLLSTQLMAVTPAYAEEAKTDAAVTAEKKADEKPSEKAIEKPAEAPAVKAEEKPPAKADDKKSAKEEKADKKAAETAKPQTGEVKDDKVKPVTDAAKETKNQTVKTSGSSTAEALPAKDADERSLPPYPENAIVAMGKFQTYVTSDEDTFLDIARHYDLGYVELRAANPTVDPWMATPGTEMLIPTFSLLPRAPQEGIVVNLAKMRLYYFKTPGQPPAAYAIGIGQEGLATPTGETTIVRKVAGPQWYPTARMRKIKPYLPAAVPAGPSNPLGTHALYLGWPTFLIHGSNKPWGIGRRVSSGCMRLYPEDIVTLFNEIAPGTRVTVVDQPILVGWHEGSLYLEANPSQTQSNDIDFDNDMKIRPLTEGMKKEIIKTAGEAANEIDWAQVEMIVKLRRGYPIAIAGKEAEAAREAMKKGNQEPPKSKFSAPSTVRVEKPNEESRKRQQQWRE